MNKNIPLLFLLLFAKNLFAQPPCDNEIMAVNGKWTKVPDAGLTETNNPQIISRINQISKLFQSAYKPRGAEAEWYRSTYNNPLLPNGPTRFGFTSLYRTWFCNSYTQKLNLGDETATWAYVFANSLHWFAWYEKSFIIQKNPVYLLTKKVGEFNGYPLYEGEHSGTWNTGTTYSRTIIITRDGQSPYLPVTKKQYLNAYLNGIEKRMLKQLLIEEKKQVRSDQAEADDKKKHLEYIERSTRADKIEKAKESYLRNYRTDIQRREEDLDKLKKMFEKQMKPARELLAAITEEEGLQPAIVEGNYVSGFEKFSTDEAGGRMLVRLNPDYFNSKLPTYVPQFLIVYWRWKKGVKPSEYFKDQLQANLNIDALKKMIDK